MAVSPYLLARPYFSTEDAWRFGVTSRALQGLVRQGALVRIKRGWFTALWPTYPSEQHVLRTGIALDEHPGSVASHLSALVQLTLPVRGQALRIVHLTRLDDPPNSIRRRGEIQFHKRLDDLPVVKGKRCVGARFAIVQAALLDPASGLMAADHYAATRPGVDAATFAPILNAYAGHNGIAMARQALRLTDGRRESPGESECSLCCHLLGFPLEIQVPLTGFSGRVYRVDGYLRQLRTIVEYDGESKYQTHADLVQEKKRQDDLRRAKYRFARVTKHELSDPALLRALLLNPETYL